MPKHRTKTGILLAAFGSAGLSGEKALASFAELARHRFPGIPVRWAFTSDRMRSRLAAVGKKTDSVKKALCRMGFERYTHVAVQSLHLIPGIEYEALLEETAAARLCGGPGCITVGSPLLHDPDDVGLAAAALLRHLPEQRRAGEPVVCVGHGSWHAGAAGYAALAAATAATDPAIFIAALSGEHSVASLLPEITAAAEKNTEPAVWLLPLLSIIGKHAEQDIAGRSGTSCRGVLESAGLDCRCVLTGTVEYAGFAEIWLAHLANALERLKTTSPAAS